jgi:FkbM family methyltransferase
MPESGGSGGEYYMALGTYEELELGYVVDRMLPGGGFVDVGAHFGYFSLAAAAAVGGSGRVIAIEPTPSSAKALRRNISENGFETIVTVVEAAASDEVGPGSLVVSDHSQMFNTLEAETLASTAGVLEIELVTVDAVLESMGWPDIDLIKMDVEGHERKVLMGAMRTLDRFPAIEVLFEASGTSPERMRVSLETIAFLEELGFEFFELGSVGASDPSSVDRLQQRMQMPRWQDSLFNVVARRV